ncbi:MAG TPA: DUF4031 domain-containing protein [Acidimicrobiales bacterium]
MTLLVDECRWPWRGRLWCHLVSDNHLNELHAFARRLALPRRAFQGDHYDLDEVLRGHAVALGAEPVPSRELLARLRGAGLRLSPAQRRQRDRESPVRLPPEEWVGRRVEVQVDHPYGSPLYSGARSTVNLGHVPGTAGWGRLPLAAYVLGPAGPVTRASGTVVAVLRRHDDVEDRLAVATGHRWDVAAIAAAVAGHERWFASEVLTV